MMKISRDLQDLTLNVKNLANIIKDLQEEKDQAQQYYGPRPEDDEENWDWPHWKVMASYWANPNFPHRRHRRQKWKN